MEFNFLSARTKMVTLIKARGVKDPLILAALLNVPRHLFVPKVYVNEAYNDHPLIIGYHQTISQPYIVAVMTAAAELNNKSKVLEIGTGSGYQSAILAEICREVFLIEIIEELSLAAYQVLSSLGYDVHTKIADGAEGWPDKAPFNAILVTAAAHDTPVELMRQLVVGGHLIIPIGPRDQIQALMKFTKTSVDNDYTAAKLLTVRFVEMVTA